MSANSYRECKWRWLNAKNRRICDCHRRCWGWFGASTTVAEACSSECIANDGNIHDQNQILSVEQYQKLFMKELGYDPLPNDNITIEGLADPTGGIKANRELLTKALPYVGLGVLVIIIALVAVALIKK